MGDVTRKLPAEVLAACLRFLDFRDLVAASHVSGFWRSSALAFPDLWAQISIDGSFWTSADLLHTAISRAKGHPVDLEYFGTVQLPDGMAEAIEHHLERFRSLKWTYRIFGLNLRQPAPLLRELACDDLLFSVFEDFLGGSMAEFCALHVGDATFPRICPALATVTDLRARYPDYIDSDAGFQYIFTLCPMLETLHLYDLAGTAGTELPVGPAPRTLRDVVLLSSTGCNVVELYAAWALESVHDVQIVIPINVEFDLAAFLSGALELSVAFEGEDWDDAAARIVARLPAGRTRTLVCPELDTVWDPRGSIVEMLRAAQQLLHTLAIPLVILHRATPRLQWPRLAHLSIVIYEAQLFSTGLPAPGAFLPRFRWAALDCLRALSPLDTLELHIRVASESDPPALEDAQELRAHLSSLRDCVPHQVQVHGFPAHFAREMPPRDEDEPRIVLH